MAKLTALLTLNTAGFQTALKGAKTSAHGLKSSMAGMSSGASKGFASMGSAMKSVATGTAVVAAAVAAAGAAVGALTYKLILSGEAANSADARVRNIAKSMGLFGDQSDSVAERLNNLADKIELQTGMDGNSIQLAQAKLLTFKELANTADKVGGNFDRATQAAVDLAAAGFGAAEQNAVQLGKALNDPVNGLMALRRSGISFTEEEKAKIKTLAESNRMHEAQALVLSAIETQVGGSAKATAAASVQIKAALNQGFEEIGKPLAEALASITPQFLEFVEMAKPKLAEAGQFLVAIFRSGEALNLVWSSLKLAFAQSVNFLWATLRATIASAGQYIIEYFKTAVTFFQVLTTPEFWGGMGNAIIGIFLSAISFLQKGFSEVIEMARPLAELFGKENAFNNIQKTIQESAAILDEDAAARFSKAGDLLEPAAQKIAQRLAEAGGNMKTRFSETFANTAEAIDTSGMQREFGNTVERIKAAIPPAATGKKVGMAAADTENPTAPAVIAGGSGQLGSFAQSMNMLFGRSANAGLLEENKRQTDWLKKIHDNTKNKGTTQAPAEAVFA
ncbi:MAG: hypothetical protein ORN51_01205 [Akkermansiaceae bacterium]|nr:hypothetical protein [Akkermansiaceae bacterium]